MMVNGRDIAAQKNLEAVYGSGKRIPPYCFTANDLSLPVAGLKHVHRLLVLSQLHFPRSHQAQQIGAGECQHYVPD
jgi:hypothetical protein